ncbi:MAG: hypothetical protein MPJ50_11565 [Pirellulales bacterium]|nr:hypothetical protein [Pirellulales bacterium]
MKQTVLEGPIFEVDNDTNAKCALILWHHHNANEHTPLVAEFSFRYDDKLLGPEREPFTVQAARHSYNILQEFGNANALIAKWVDLDSPTKTRFAFSFLGNSLDRPA